MSTYLVTNIGELVTNDPGVGDGSMLGVVKDAAIVVDRGTIVWVGQASAAPAADDQIDVGGKAVIPAFVDSHTHAIFAGDRCDEFEARMSGAAYDASGVSSTAQATRAASDAELTQQMHSLVAEMRAQGTGVFEVKSGYGLDPESESRLVRLAQDVTDEVTFLAGHVVPQDASRSDYVSMVKGAMLHACRPHSRWIDVYCEPHSPHALTADEAKEILTAGISAGLLPRMQTGQLGVGPGIKLAVELGCASVNHCTHLTYGDLGALVDGAPRNGQDGTVATLLPAVDFSTRAPYPNARMMWDAGVALALATGLNPGTGFSSSMGLVIALAVREMRLTPAEALWAATAGGALSLRRVDIGRITVGCKALLTSLDAPSYRHLAYRPGVPLAWALNLP